MNAFLGEAAAGELGILTSPDNTLLHPKLLFYLPKEMLIPTVAVKKINLMLQLAQKRLFFYERISRYIWFFKYLCQYIITHSCFKLALGTALGTMLCH